MKLLAEVKQAGFTITLEGEKIRVEYAREGEPPEAAKALLDILRDHKPEVVAYLKETMPRPYFDLDGFVVIPFGTDPRYHWWTGGQNIRETEEEVRQWKH